MKVKVKVQLVIIFFHCFPKLAFGLVRSELISVISILTMLKERYRIGKKQKSWRSQIYIKLTQSNDDDSWKHPLKYICLKCHIWWEINSIISRLEFIAQRAFYSFLFWHRCNAKFVIGFSLFSRDSDGRSISNFYRFVSSCIWWITCSAYTASNCFVSKNQFCNVPLSFVQICDHLYFQSYKSIGFIYSDSDSYSDQQNVTNVEHPCVVFMWLF